jgi:hypothetical protein
MTDIETALLRAAGLDLIVKGFKAADTDNKAELAKGLLVGDRRGVALPLDGQPVKVATVTHVNGSGPRPVAYVVDEAAFLAWVQENHPEALQTTIAPWFVNQTLAAAVKTGEVVPGVELDQSAGTKPYIKVERVKTDEAHAALLGAIFAENAAGLRSLLAIEPASETTE